MSACLECEEGDGVKQSLTLLWHGPCPPRLGQEEVIPTAESVKLIPESIESIVLTNEGRVLRQLTPS